MKRILFVSHWSGSGGAEKALFEIIEHTHRVLGIECACVVNWRGSLYRNLREIGVTCYVVPYRWWCGENVPFWTRIFRTLFNVPMTLALAALILWTRSSLVYSNTYTICVGAMAAFLTRRPHVWHIHETFGVRTFDLGERFSLQAIDLLSDRIIVPSDTVARLYATFVDGNKIVRIHNALNLTTRIDQVPERPPIPGRLVSVGAVLPQKGHDEAIRAVRVLVDRDLDVSLHIVGDIDRPEYLARLNYLIAELGVTERVTFTGLLADPISEFQAAEVVVMCARDEAFGRVTVEAMLLERPVVAAASGANPEIVEHGVNGLLYTPGDTDELASAIQSLLSRPHISRELVRRAKTHARTYYSLTRYFEQWLTAVAAADKN